MLYTSLSWLTSFTLTLFPRRPGFHLCQLAEQLSGPIERQELTLVIIEEVAHATGHRVWVFRVILLDRVILTKHTIEILVILVAVVRVLRVIVIAHTVDVVVLLMDRILSRLILIVFTTL